MTFWRLAYGAVVFGFLAMVGSYYSPETGFTTFLQLAARDHASELPVLQGVPHAHDEQGAGYDGQYYAQLALDPLLRDTAIDRALDTPGYRSHRILFSWTAWLMGLGRPAWILQAYAIQNCLTWLVLGALLIVWCPPRDLRTFVLWSGVMLSHGLLSSVRSALPDGPSVVLTTAAVLAVDGGRPLLSAFVTGISGLARETNLLAAAALIGKPWRTRQAIVALLLVVAPLALWLDYLRSIYGAAVLSGAHHITIPLSGLWWKFEVTAKALTQSGFTAATVMTIASVVGFLSQGVALVWCSREFRRTGGSSASWLLVAWPFLLLGLVAHAVVWEGAPGAFTRVTLPLTVGVNALMATHARAPWWLIVPANLGVLSGVMAIWNA